ncbi:G-protein coupled receptor rickets isoform X2 [Bombus vancouverensis nearcticus]|uniref:Lutropin-choriogonadotropic hormone receptor isoform X2 n=1 Tax=Bombus bifarius TaxID=103933 RepID=A0A6P8M6M0_9HYME|nr:lutropin-choriogonadotropic hormone receptor isoform X2 [Bombus vancouverensis nearcticus]XP_033303633.1 lutropin-choriogonadotropic hormone receptor isoform X2 [Bombus bifarius]
MCTQSSRGITTAAVILAMFLCRICSAEEQPGSSSGPGLLESCNVTADGREFSCRGAGFLSILEPLDVTVLPSTVNLTKLDLTSNNITDIPARAFHRIFNLEVLLLRRNHLHTIADDAFTNLTSLRVLELDDNYLTKIPTAIVKLSGLEDLSLSNNRIETLEEHVFQRVTNLLSLDLRGNPIKEIHGNTFRNLYKLRKLILSNLKELRIFPNLNGTKSLEVLRLDRAQVTSVPTSLCEQCPKLKSLDMKSNFLTEMPNLRNCSELRVLDLASNVIPSLPDEPFKGLNMLHDLLLSNNKLQVIPSDAFVGLSRLQVLDLESNYIEYIHPDAFKETKHLEDLNLGNNVFPALPTLGLSGLLHLKTFNNPALREFPAPERFPRVQTMVLSYAYHCCSFLSVEVEDPVTKSSVQESILFPTDNDFDMILWNSSFTDIWPQLNFTYPGNLPSYVEDYFEEQNSRATQPARTLPSHVQCLPQPGPFLPCQDLFDWWTLRCGVWVVFLLAMLGNGTVAFVLIFSRSKMDVPRFLVCNLAAADLFMGIYLGLLAVVDASTLGEFRMYAIPWQTSAGCQLAGFLGVFSSELSVYTLAVITLERHYAITHAMHLNKRLSLKHAGYVMIAGWGFALSMASLPLVGVSDYRKFAICLPFETNGNAALVYVTFLMLINGVAFLILMGCYLKMYCAIRGSQAWNSNDSRIAKRMALLVFTDFVCWAPIAFFSLTATFGLQLVSLEHAKIFAVFVLPLNSCCNPFLYAILTKQFKKDCVLICKAIEESRVTRGIGRCRHSSNFSNRQTPVNTNSLVDRSSRENQAPCACNSRLLETSQCSGYRRWGTRILWPCARDTRPRHARSDQYAYQIAEIQQKQHKRASSVSSSENFSSSRSDSWRQTHHCGIPLRLLDPKRRASSWLITRKPSQESNLSSSRNDSSGSATTASTSTWRISRSSASLEINARNTPRPTRSKPRLTRQLAIQEPEPPGSPSRLAVRLLATIPSAAETSDQQDDDNTPQN